MSGPVVIPHPVIVPHVSPPIVEPHVVYVPHPVIVTVPSLPHHYRSESGPDGVGLAIAFGILLVIVCVMLYFTRD